MDLITQLPKSGGKDAILTIVDHGCTRAATFLPCTTTITAEGVAQLYMEHVYRWFGLPNKIISDRDPRFTSLFAKALCKKLHIQQNMSTAFHPQTDGLSKRKNQWVEQFLRLVAEGRQDDWSEWLPLATAVHNGQVNAMLGITPTQALLGYFPLLNPLAPPLTTNPKTEDRVEQAAKFRQLAQKMLDKVANWTPPDQFEIGAKVWLEGSNLALPYQTRKLAPKRHGPFTITKQISPVTYKLQLPPAWTIHDIFHASLLTPYWVMEQKRTNYLRPPLELVDGEEEFEVENVLRHRYFGKRRNLQYLIKWKGYPTADNTWEPVEQVFAPTKVQAYHRAHPIERPWPHKRTMGASINLTRSCFPCQTSMPPQVWKLLSLTVPLLPQSQKPTKMSPSPRPSQRYPLRSRLRKTKTCPSGPSTPEPIPFVLSPPFQPYRFLEPTQQGRHKSKSEKSPNSSLPPSNGEGSSSGPVSSDSERGMSGRGQISIGSGQKCISELIEFPLAHRALSLMAPALSTFGSPSEGDPPKPITSDNPPETLQLSKEPWGGPATTSTITSSMLAHTHPPGMSALPQRVRYLVGSKPCSMRLILDFEPSLLELKTSTTGDSLQTFSDTAAQPSESVPSRTSERTLK